MKDDRLKIRSINENLRLCVIENSIYVEELISETIGDILNIDWEKSKSFGYNSTALSFNQKVHIIQDIKGIDKEDINKLTCLMNIRNKFAHVSIINSFEDLFTKSNIGKEIKSSILKWYFDSKGVTDIPQVNHERVFRLCFYLLVNDIVDILLKIIKAHWYNKGIEAGQNEFKERFLENLVFAIRKQDGGEETLLSIFEEIKQTVYNKGS